MLSLSFLKETINFVLFNLRLEFPLKKERKRNEEKKKGGRKDGKKEGRKEKRKEGRKDLYFICLAN